MSEIFGDFIEQFPPEQNSLELRFTLNSHLIRKRWRTQHLSTHFVADYFTNFLPVDEDDPNSGRRVKESKGAVSYIANELLENAIKFNDETRYKVKFGIRFMGDFEISAIILATNSIRPDHVKPFQAFIQELLLGDPNDLYIQQVEKSAESCSETSGLGLLTLINDYAAKLGWKFETCEGDRAANRPTIAVTTMAQIVV